MECLLNPDDFSNLFYLRRRLLLSYDAFNQLQDYTYIREYILHICGKAKRKIQKNNNFYTRLTNNHRNAQCGDICSVSPFDWIQCFVHLCGCIRLNERVMFNRNSIFRAFACSHLGFNRIIGNDNDIYIETFLCTSIRHSHVLVDPVCHIAMCHVVQSYIDCIN